MNSLNQMNKIFKEAFEKDFNYYMRHGKLPPNSPSPQQIREATERDQMEKYLLSLPPLKRGVYKVKCLEDVYNMWGQLVGKQGEIIEMKNDGLKPKDCSMGTKHYAGCINQDGGMSPSELYIPGKQIEILEFLG